jgi:hypothetical protein
MRADPWATFAWTIRATWHELAPIIGVSVAWSLTGVPLVVALATGETWLALLASLPTWIATTALFGVLADVANGGAVRRPESERFDPALGALAWAWAGLAASLAGMGSYGVLAGCALGAIGVLVLPLAFAYGAIRGRRGLAALRGGTVLAIIQPGMAISLAGTLCLAAFACVASAGTLLLVAPGLVGLLACRAVVVMLTEVETDPEM